MSKQALHKRFERSGIFLKNTLQYFLEKYLKIQHNDIKILKDFNDIKIFDSTTIELSDDLASEWKGYSGDGSKSGIKIISIYSLYTKSFLDIYTSSTIEIYVHHNAQKPSFW